MKIDIPDEIVLSAAAEDEYTGDEFSGAMAEGTQIVHQLSSIWQMPKRTFRDWLENDDYY